MSIEFAFVTVNRPQGYIHTTLNSISSTGFFIDGNSLRLVLGSLDSEYLNRYRNHPSISIEEMTKEEYDYYKMEKMWNIQKLAVTNCRAIERLKSDVILVFEDDIIFASGWLKRLNNVLEDVRLQLADDWVMSIYTPNCSYPEKLYNRGVLWFVRHIEPMTAFFGMQGILYPRKWGVLFREYLLKESIGKCPPRAPIDHLLALFAVKNKILIVSPTPSLIQHIGDVSAGISSIFHTSHSFLKELK